jgi:hypothetical protein
MGAADQPTAELAALISAAVESALAAQAPAKRTRKATKEKTLAESSKVSDHSPMSAEDRAFLDEYDWDANLDANRTRAREVFERLMVGSARPANEAAGAGKCAECGNDGPWRERWGTFEVCAGCASRRYVVALKVAAEVVRAEVA